jgi:hypothetical protein
MGVIRKVSGVLSVISVARSLGEIVFKSEAVSVGHIKAVNSVPHAKQSLFVHAMNMHPKRSNSCNKIPSLSRDSREQQ